MQEEIMEWLHNHAEKVPSDIDPSKMKWITKSRGDYITLQGMEDKLEFLVSREITDYVASIWEAGKPINIGFNPEEKKWYGWSHRAIFGFGVGAECKRGDCCYRPIDKDDFLNDTIRFWSDDYHINVTGEHREEGVYIEWEVSQTVPNEKARGQITGIFAHYPERYGRGEWKAETLADARQMAIDFANSVA